MIDIENKTITIKLPKGAYSVDKANGLTKKQKEKLKKLIKREIKTVKNHFKKDGWDLDFDCIRSDIICDLIGQDFFGIVASEILHAAKGKLNLIHEKKFLLRDPNHKPVYAHKVTGELVVAENSQEGKDYINRGYQHIGVL